MTGEQIRALRGALGVTPPAFGDLLGTSTSTVYRWESFGADYVRTEPAQRRILVLLREELERRDPRERGRLARDIASALTMGGGLLGLHCLSFAAYGDRWSKPKRSRKKQ